MATWKNNRKTVQKLHSSEHIICLYDDLIGMEETTLTFLAEGLRRNEKCICLISPNRPDIYYRMLEDHFASQNIRPNQLVFVDASEVFLNRNRLDSLQMIIFLMGQLREASREGYKSTRCILDMGWTGYDDWGLLDCENLLNKYLIPYFGCTLLCGYNLERLNPRLLREIAINHPRVMCGEQVINNDYYAPPKPFLVQSKGKPSLDSLLEAIYRDYKKQTKTSFKVG